MYRALFIGLVIGLVSELSVLAEPGFCSHSSKKDYAIVIKLYDYVHPGSRVIAGAEQTASEILGDARVSLTWVNVSIEESAASPSHSPELTDGVRVDLHLVPKSVIAQSQLKKQRDFLGIAAASEVGGFATDFWVFYEPVKLTALDGRLDLPQILGSVIAHELGHLLLGANSHSRDGLMCARWSREQLLAAELTHLRFSEEQCRRIRDRLGMRPDAHLTE